MYVCVLSVPFKKRGGEGGSVALLTCLHTLCGARFSRSGKNNNKIFLVSDSVVGKLMWVRNVNLKRKPNELKKERMVCLLIWWPCFFSFSEQSSMLSAPAQRHTSSCWLSTAWPSLFSLSTYTSYDSSVDCFASRPYTRLRMSVENIYVYVCVWYLYMKRNQRLDSILYLYTHTYIHTWKGKKTKMCLNVKARYILDTIHR
jgi:hypothetical protein